MLSMEDYGKRLEQAGWLQGKVVSSRYIKYIFDNADSIIGIDTAEYSDTSKIVFIVASQSCDIANRLHPYVELSFGLAIDKSNSAYMHNNHPRRLHLSTYEADGDGINTRLLETNIHQKIFISKNYLVEVEYDNSVLLDEQTTRDYKYWLAAQYSRPALPTSFNDRLRAADPKNKLKKNAKKLHESTTGIYIELFPFAEIPESDNYSLNLLILLAENANVNDDKIVSASNNIADLFRSAGMDVQVRVVNETDISIAVLRRFTRIYLDDLSFRDETSGLPPEVRFNS